MPKVINIDGAQIGEEGTRVVHVSMPEGWSEEDVKKAATVATAIVNQTIDDDNEATRASADPIAHLQEAFGLNIVEVKILHEAVVQAIEDTDHQDPISLYGNGLLFGLHLARVLASRASQDDVERVI